MKKNNTGFITGILLLIILIFAINLIYNFATRKDYHTVVCEKEYFEETFPAEGMIIFNQKFYATGKDADIFVKEGERVSVGTKLFVSGVSESPELQQINLMILNVEGQTEEAYFLWIDDMREAEFKGDLGKAELLKKTANFTDSDLFYQKTEELPEYDLDSLMTRKAELEAESGNLQGQSTVYSEISGIVSLSGSKVFPEFNVDNMENIRASDFDRQFDFSGDYLRIVDNFSATTVLRAEKKDFKDIPEVGNRLRIKADKEEINAYISEVKEDGDYYIIFSKIKNELHKLINFERARFDIIEFSGDVFKLPKEAIIRDGVNTGVFTDFKKRIVRYVPVKILKEGGEYVYVSPGDKSSHIEDPVTKESVLTLRQYDEVFLHPQDLKEDEILNRN